MGVGLPKFCILNLGLGVPYNSPVLDLSWTSHKGFKKNKVRLTHVKKSGRPAYKVHQLKKMGGGLPKFCILNLGLGVPYNSPVLDLSWTSHKGFKKNKVRLDRKSTRLNSTHQI